MLAADYLKPIAEEERRVEAEEKKKREELERIAKELAEGNCAHYLRRAAALGAPEVPSHGLQALCVHRLADRALKGSPSCPCVQRNRAKQCCSLAELRPS